MPSVPSTAVALTDASACPACGGRGRPTRLVVREGADPYRLRRCQSCGTQYLRPGVDHPAWADESRYWDDKEFKLDIYASTDVRRDYDERYRSVLQRLRTRVGDIRTVLDVGCGSGNFLSLAGREGLVAVGVDVDPRPVAAARSAGLSAYTPAELDAHVADGSVDAVTMWDVIEHVIDPGELLSGTVRKLRPGGVLVVETPDAGFPLRSLARALDTVTFGHVGLARRLYYWEHKTYFSETGLRELLATHGCTTLFVDRMTSPRAKMAHLFSRSANEGIGPRLLRRSWPWLEATARHLGRGNKLLAVASA